MIMQKTEQKKVNQEKSYQQSKKYNELQPPCRLQHLKREFLQLEIESPYGSDEIKIKLFSINKKTLREKENYEYTG